jgi:hypothetical protein
MRIHYEGDFAYDLVQPRDPQTQLALNWKFAVYRLRPVEEIVAKGEAPTRAEAERKAKSTIRGLLSRERHVAA